MQTVSRFGTVRRGGLRHTVRWGDLRRRELTIFRFASRYRPPGADCVIPFDGRSLTARVDHLQHPKASCLRRLNTPTAGALVASISTYNERKESSRNSLNRGTFRRTRGGRLSAYLHIISLSDAGRSSNCRHECLSPYNLFEPLIQCNITFPSRLTTARCYWDIQTEYADLTAVGPFNSVI